MKTLFLFTSLLFYTICFSQAKYSTVTADFVTFHENISAGERMFKNDSLLQAYGRFDVGIAPYKGGVNPGDYFRAALCAIKIKEEFKGLHYLEKAVTSGYEIDSTKKELVSFYNQNTKKEFQDNFNKWESSRKSQLNAAYIAELNTINESSKKFAAIKYTSAVEYCLNCNKTKNCSKTTPDYLSKYRLLKEKMKGDSVAAAALLKSIQSYGFPSMKLVGKKGAEIGRNILLNFDADKNNDKLDGILYRAMIDGNISPEFYATLIDRRNVMSGIAPEFYEPITGYEKTIGKEIVTANQKRATIGLYPLKPISATSTKPKDPNAKKPDIRLYDY